MTRKELVIEKAMEFGVVIEEKDFIKSKEYKNLSFYDIKGEGDFSWYAIVDNVGEKVQEFYGFGYDEDKDEVTKHMYLVVE